jgi:hypothetical protein
VRSVGSWVFVGTAVLVVAALGAGYLAGAGRSSAVRRVTMLGIAPRPGTSLPAVLEAPDPAFDIVTP